MNYLRLLLFTGILWGCFSCSKEKSGENFIRGNANCTINKVVSFDKTLGKGTGSYTLEIQNNHPSNVALYDSTDASIILNIDFTYNQDSIKIGRDEYFLLDSEGRVKELVIHQMPNNTNSEKFLFKYYYDSQGYLKSKEWYKSASLSPLFVYSYFWENGNLVKSEVREGIGERRMAMLSQISYDFSTAAKNFLYYLPESGELSPFAMLLNLGKKPQKLASQIVVQVYDANGAVENKYITNYSDYKFTQDGYVAELLAEGDIVDGMSMVQGLTKFSYTCK